MSNRLFLFAIIAFIIYSFFSLAGAINPVEGLADTFKFILLFFLILCFSSMLVTHANKMLPLIYKAVIINSFIAVCIGVYQLLNLTFTIEEANQVYEIKGLMAHKNQYSISLFLLLPFNIGAIVYFEKIWKRLAIIALVVNLTMIIILQTRAVWMALFFASIFVLVNIIIINRKKQIIKIDSRFRKRLFIISGATIVLFFGLISFAPKDNLAGKVRARIITVFDPDFTSNQWRVEMWNATTEVIRDNPLTGVGGGNWKIAIYPYYSKYQPSVYRHWRNPHNDYLQVGAEKGVPGLILYLSFLTLLIVSGVMALKRADNFKKLLLTSGFVFSLFGFMVISFFSFPMERPNQIVFIGLIASFIIYFNRSEEPIVTQTNYFKWFRFPIAIILLAIFIHSANCVNSEIQIALAQAAKEKGDWKGVKYFAEKGKYRFAPFEPKYSFPIVMYNGLAYFHLDKDYPQALKYFEQALKQHPSSISVMNNIGAVYGQMKDFEKTIHYNKMSLAIFPHYEFGLINLAKSYYMMGDYVAAYHAILKCDPRSENKEIGNLREFIEGKINQISDINLTQSSK
ncbi:MAG: O-antigen ligase family protein [Bacteroidales bacterium]|nr:O-antigen ligase family protein [Bacteroidales bacterium]